MGSDDSQKTKVKDDDDKVKLVTGKALIFMLILVGSYIGYQWYSGEVSLDFGFNIISPVLIIFGSAWAVGITRKMFVGRFKALRRTTPYIFTYCLLMGFASLFFSGIGFGWILLILPICGIVLGRGSDVLARKVAPNTKKKIKSYLSTLKEMKVKLEKTLTVNIDVGRVINTFGPALTGAVPVSGQPTMLQVALNPTTNDGINQTGGVAPYNPKIATDMETRKGVIWGAPLATVEDIIRLLTELEGHEKQALQHEINQKLPLFARAVSVLFENTHSFKWENKKVRALGKKSFITQDKTRKQIWVYKKFKENQQAMTDITDILMTMAQVLSELNPMLNLDLSKDDSPILMAAANPKYFEKKGDTQLGKIEYTEVGGNNFKEKFTGVINRIKEYTAILQSKDREVKPFKMDKANEEKVKKYWPQELTVEYWKDPTRQGKKYEVNTNGKTEKKEIDGKADIIAEGIEAVAEV